MENNTQMMLAIFAIVAALGLLGVVAITIVTIPQEAEARCQVFGTGYNASQGRCNPG
jgi:hypothetical protein